MRKALAGATYGATNLATSPNPPQGHLQQIPTFLSRFGMINHLPPPVPKQCCAGAVLSNQKDPFSVSNPKSLAKTPQAWI